MPKADATIDDRLLAQTTVTGNADGPARVQRIEQAIVRLLHGELAKPLAPGLHIVATPIGNLCDFSVRGAAVLARCDTVLCEDTRHSRKLLNAYGLTSKLAVYEEHSAEKMRPRIAAWLAAGERVGLISDAGTPLISDPGFKLVRDTIQAGHAVTSIPGASAATAALAASGLPTDTFHFIGFLPSRAGQRRSKLKAAAQLTGALVIYEAAGRLAGLLADINACLGERHVVIARELTKQHETWLRGTPNGLLAELGSHTVKGELTVLLAGADLDAGSAIELRRGQMDSFLEDALETMTVRDAARRISADLQLPKAEVYQRALELSAAHKTATSNTDTAPPTPQERS